MRSLQRVLDAWHARPAWVEQAAACSLSMAGAAAILFGGSYTTQYLGTVFVLLSAFSMRKAFLRLTDRPIRHGAATWTTLISEVLPPLFLACATLVIYAPLIEGAMPLIGDHQVHEYNAYILGSHMLPSGRVMGWSNMAGAGYPAGQLYPPGGSLWIALVHTIGFGHLSWDASYAYGLLAVLLFVNLSIYWVGRRLFGPLAGLVAGIAMLTDMGGFRQGGWIFTMQFGVWPLTLSLAFGFLFVERIARLAVGPNIEDTIWAALWLGLGLLTHPMILLFAALLIPIAIAYGSTIGSGPKVWLSIFGAGILGTGLASFWLVPFLLNAPTYSVHVSDLWKSLPQIGQDLVTASLYQNCDPWILVLGLVGLIWMSLEGRPKGRFAAMTAAILLAVSSITIYGASNIERILPSIRHVQFERFVMFIKVFLALGAGFVAQRILAGIPKGLDGPASPPARPKSPTAHPKFAAVLTAMAIAPLLTPVLTGWFSKRLAPLTDFQTTRDRPAWRKAMRHLLDRAKKTAQRDPRGFFRVAYWSDFNDHKMAAGPVLSDLPQVKCSYIPAETYRFRAHPQPRDIPSTSEDFKLLAVRFLLADRPPPASVRKWTLLGREANLSLYENPKYRWTPATLDAPGKIDVIRFEDERITLRISGLEKPTRLVLHVPEFPNWTARQNFRSLAITKANDLAPHVQGLMSVTVHNGVVDFRYQQTTRDILAKILSVVSLAFLVLLVLVVKGNPSAVRAWKKIARLQRPALWTIWIVSAALATGLAVKWARAPKIPPEGHSLTWDLSRAKVWLEGPSGRKPCRWYLDGRYICGKKAHQYVGPISEEWGLKNHRGIWAHPYRNARLVIEYSSVTMGRHITIDHGILGTGVGGKGIVHLRIQVGTTTLADITHRAVGWRTRTLDTSKWANTTQRVRFEIWTNDISARHFAFDATIQP